MTDKIREAFEKWFRAFFRQEPMPLNSDHLDFCWHGYLAGRQSMLDELEQVGFTAMSGHGRVLALQPTIQPEKWEPIYRLPEGVTK